jgi:hypothetical protein
MLGLFSAVSLVHAEIIEFDLSPPGSSAAVGLSPANEVPPIVGTGFGNEISGGITFDTETAVLSINFGYGSAAGFTDLTGPAIGVHIHAPAPVGANAVVSFDLGALSFVSAGNPAAGGVVYGSVLYPPEKVDDLLAGLNYVNIHTAANSGGEIRAQLIPLINRAPDIVCPPASVVECGEELVYSATVSDEDGDAVQVVWTLNGEVVQTDDIDASEPPSGALLEYTATLPLGDNTLELTATDSAGNVSSCSSVITVVDTTPPVIEKIWVSPSVVWPPNHKMVNVTVRADVTDTCSDTTWKIVSISSSEDVDAVGSGNTSPDYEITGDHTADVRAERSGPNKDGRVYTITVEAEDESGNVSAPATVEVLVPHSMAKKKKNGPRGK